MEKQASIRESSEKLIEKLRSKINNDLHRKVNKIELLDKNELRAKTMNNMTERLINTINEYDRQKDVRSPLNKDEKQIAELMNNIGIT